MAATDLAPEHNVLECLPVGAVCGTYHYTVLYDLIGAALLIGVLWWMLRRRWQPGVMFAVWVGLVWGATVRHRFSPGSATMDRMAGPLTWSQWVGLGAGLAAIGWLIWRSRTGYDRPAPVPVGESASGS